MSGLIESAATVMAFSEKRLAVTAGNVSNMSVAGYKTKTSFSEIFSAENLTGSTQRLFVESDFEQGKLVATGHTFDMAIGGEGFFKLRAANQIVISRHGQFHRTADGTLVNQQGHVLQQAGGGDLVLDGAAAEILPDGTVLEGERLIGRIALVTAEAPGALQSVGAAAFAASEEQLVPAEQAQVHQGMIEASNVDLASEMMATMRALRQSETGARLAMTYDELLGRAITTLGQGGS